MLNAHVLAQIKPFYIQTISSDVKTAVKKQQQPRYVSNKKRENLSKPALAVRLTLRYLRWIMFLYRVIRLASTIFGTAFRWRFIQQHRVLCLSLFVSHVPLHSCLVRCPNALITRTKDSCARFFSTMELFEFCLFCAHYRTFDENFFECAHGFYVGV